MRNSECPLVLLALVLLQLLAVAAALASSSSAASAAAAPPLFPAVAPALEAAFPHPLVRARQDGLSEWGAPSERRASSAPALRELRVAPASWQGALLPLLANLTLKQMVLPGTHDSGAYALSAQLAPLAQDEEWLLAALALARSLGLPVEQVITPWALAQRGDVLAQALAGGSRYVDLRVCWNGSEWLTHHFETGEEIRTIMTDVRRFVDQQASEVVVIEAQLWQPAGWLIPPSAKAELADLILKTFAGVLYPNEGVFNSTYSQLLQRSWRVLVSVDDAELLALGGGALWDGRRVVHNTYANSANLTTMQQFNQQQLTVFNGAAGAPLDGEQAALPTGCGRALDGPSASLSGCLFKLSWTLTPDAGAILGSLQPGWPRSLLELANVANTQLDAWLASGVLQPGWTLGNLVIADDVLSANCTLLPVVVAQNMRIARQVFEDQPQLLSAEAKQLLADWDSLAQLREREPESGPAPTEERRPKQRLKETEDAGTVDQLVSER